MGKSSSRLAMMQQMARGSRASPRDRAKPTEQHIATLAPQTEEWSGMNEEWRRREAAAEPGEHAVTAGERESLGLIFLPH